MAKGVSQGVVSKKSRVLESVVPSESEKLKIDVLQARAQLKQLLDSGLEARAGRWDFETAEYAFCRLSEDIIAAPNYGFGLCIKSTGQYAYWYRDKNQTGMPLLVFRCNSQFLNAELIN